MMKFNRNNIDDPKALINGLKPIKQSENFDNVNYIYPNFHGIKHQVRWFKGSRDRGLKSNMAA